jgi:hypothetical protein
LGDLAGDETISLTRRACHRFSRAACCAPFVDCRVALCQSQQRSDQQYFADGITEDLTTDLSRIAHT